MKNLEKERFFYNLKTIFEVVDLDNMQLINKYNKRIKYLLCVIDLFSKYEWVIPLKDKRGITIVNAFQKIFKQFKKETK